LKRVLTPEVVITLKAKKLIQTPGSVTRPRQNGEGPEKQFKIGSGKTDPEALRFFWKEPGVAHIAIEGRLEKNQGATHFVNIAAEMGAREAVTKFMGSDDEKIQGDDQSNLRDAIKLGKAFAKVGPIGDRNSDGCGNGDEREDHKKGRIEEASPRDHAFQQLAGIKNLEPAVERAAAKPALFRIWTRLPGTGKVEHAVLFQTGEEGNENFRWELRVKMRFRSLDNLVHRCFAVELLSDKLLGFSESEEPSGGRVLDNKRRCRAPCGEDAR